MTPNGVTILFFHKRLCTTRAFSASGSDLQVHQPPLGDADDFFAHYRNLKTSGMARSFVRHHFYLPAVASFFSATGHMLTDCGIATTVSCLSSHD